MVANGSIYACLSVESGRDGFLFNQGSLPVRGIAKRMAVSIAPLYRYVGNRGNAAPVKDLAAAHV